MSSETIVAPVRVGATNKYAVFEVVGVVSCDVAIVNVTAPGVPLFVAIPGLEESIENSNVVLLCTVQTIADEAVLKELFEEFGDELFVALTLFDNVTVKTVPSPLTCDVAVQLENP